MRRLSGRFVLVFILGAVVLSFNFGSRLLLTNDDTRFPVLARDVLVNGHWLLPALPDGTSHLAKPPLVAWLIALTSWPVGAVSVATAVLPSLLEAIGVTLLTYWLGCRLVGPDAGVVAGLTVATTVGVYSMAHSSMPDMAQLVAVTGAMAVYVASGFGDRRIWLVVFYGIIGVGSLAKGAAGFVPLAIVLADTISARGVVGLKRLVSIPGWGVLREPFAHAVTVLLPWGLLLPFAVRRAFHEADPDTVRRVRLLLVWLATVFAIMAVSGNQRERYYLPLCPAAALLIGWWYSTLAWRGRAWAFASAWIAVVAVGAGLVMLSTSHINATTDLRALRAVLAQAPAPLYSFDLQDLALSFNLDRPVVATNYQTFEDQVLQGETGYLIISNRALSTQRGDICMRRIATGLVTRRPFTVLDPKGCSGRVSSPDDRRSG